MRSRALQHHLISFGLAIVVGAIVGLLLVPLRPTMRVVAGYDAAALVLLLWYWCIALQRSPEQARRRAAIEDPGWNVVMIVVIAAVAFGMVAAIAVLGRGADNKALPHLAAADTLALIAVVFGWLLIHTVFLFRYARMYYGHARHEKHVRDANADAGAAPPADGDETKPLIFPGGREPGDLDFAYFSFVLGMTFQVSDVQVASAAIRRVALVHGVISFAYNTAILALVVNVVSGLLH